MDNPTSVPVIPAGQIFDGASRLVTPEAPLQFDCELLMRDDAVAREVLKYHNARNTITKPDRIAALQGGLSEAALKSISLLPEGFVGTPLRKLPSRRPRRKIGRVELDTFGDDPSLASVVARDEHDEAFASVNGLSADQLTELTVQISRFVDAPVTANRRFRQLEKALLTYAKSTSLSRLFRLLSDLLLKAECNEWPRAEDLVEPLAAILKGRLLLPAALPPFEVANQK